MKKYAILALAIAFFASSADARSMLLLRKEISELETIAPASIDPAADFIPVYDFSAKKVKKSLVSSTGLITGTGRATIKICGDATTVNNNTVYYGPSQVVAAGGLQTCNIAAAGSTTEATADAPAFDATAFQVLSMNCYVTDPGATVNFTLRSAAAATTPSMTCSVADNGNDCHTSAGTTTAIASGATVAIAAASTADMGAAQFVCELNVAY
jgi:hypothetical protein